MSNDDDDDGDDDDGDDDDGDDGDDDGLNEVMKRNGFLI